MVLDQDWLTDVLAWCDPVFERADVGFTRQLPGDAILWEADPRRFAARYPDSGIVESYGNQWPDVHCIDFWVYLDQPGRVRVSVEGWELPDVEIRLTGTGFDGHSIAAYFARALELPPPTDWLDIDE